ncbi:MAG: hypothetical protein ACI8RL_002290 [Cyclobacteriaceae bacterium]|jgi:hypothetical protein
MKSLIAVLAICLISLSASAQEFPKMDPSPLDAAYFPPRAAFRSFEKTDEAKKANEPKIRVIYSRPQKKDREVFGGLVKFGEVWRIGANEATEIMFFESATIGGKKLKAGRYTVYAIPQADKWEVHFSSDKDMWGQYAYDPAKSLVTKISVPTTKTTENVESMTIMFEAVDGGAHMIMGWDDTMVRVPIMM